MSQSNMVIENTGPLNVRQQIQLALQAAASNNSGPGEPATTYAFMSWADEANDLLKLRNADNTGWVSLAVLSTGKPVGSDVVQVPVRNCVLNKEPITQGSVTKPGFETVLGTAASTIDDIMFLRTKKSKDNPTNYYLETSAMPGKYIRTHIPNASVVGAPPATDATDITWQHSLTHVVTGTTDNGRTYTCHYNPNTGISVTLVAAGAVTGNQKIPSHLTEKTEYTQVSVDAEGYNQLISHESFKETEALYLDANSAIVDSATHGVIHTDDGIILTGASSNHAAELLIIQQHSVEGFSKIGTYNPSGQVGWELELGFKMGYWYTKNSGSTDSHHIIDVMRPEKRLLPDLSNAQQNIDYFAITDTSLIFKTDSNNINQLGKTHLYVAYVDSHTDATHSQANYQEPTTPDTLTISEGSLVTFADGFNSVGAVDTAITVGTGIIYQMPAGNEGKTVFIYMNGDGTIGCTQVPFAVGKSRPAADTWGVQSDNGFRTTAVHSEAKSVTGVVSATSVYADIEGYSAWEALSGGAETGHGSWLSGSTAFNTSNGDATHARGYEEWRYMFNEKRTINALRLKARYTNSPTPWPKHWEAFAVVDGALVSLISLTNQISPSQNVWDTLREVASTVCEGIAIRVTAASGAGYTSFAVDLRTSAPKGDFYNVPEAVTYDATDTPIKRVYLAEVDVDSNDGAVNIRNYPVAKSNVMGMTVHGFLVTTENVKILDVGSIQNNRKYYVPLPKGWKGEDCDVRVEILSGGEWSQGGWATHTAISQSYGTSASINSDRVKIVTGITALMHYQTDHGFEGFTAGVVTSAKCRLVIVNKGRASNG